MVTPLNREQYDAARFIRFYHAEMRRYIRHLSRMKGMCADASITRERRMIRTMRECAQHAAQQYRNATD